MDRPLSAAALRRGDQDGASRLRVVRCGPSGFDERLGGKKAAGFGVQDIEETILGGGHRHVTLFPVDRDVGHHDLVVFRVHPLGASLEVPDVFSGVRLHRDDALGEELFSGNFDSGHFTVADVRARGAKNHEACGVVISDGVPYIASADFPRAFAEPGFRGHLQFFCFEAFRGIARNGPEAPNFLARLGVIGRKSAADAIIRAVVAH